jgi:hypothetical protein
MIRRLPLALWLATAACSATEVRVEGGEPIETIVPRSKRHGDGGLEDGFTISYLKFLVAVSDVTISGEHRRASAEKRQRIYDLKRIGPHPIARFPGAQRWKEVHLTVRPAVDAVAGDADPDDVAFMNAHHYSLYVSGTAVATRFIYAFAWGFETTSQHTAPASHPVFTARAEVLFEDDLDEANQRPRFGPILAADRNHDARITLEELATVSSTVNEGIANARSRIEALSTRLFRPVDRLELR